MVSVATLVVAVFATGQGWQFKDWPAGYMNPVELFSKVRNCIFVTVFVYLCRLGKVILDFEI